jgi:hypothetical protein
VRNGRLFVGSAPVITVRCRRRTMIGAEPADSRRRKADPRASLLDHAYASSGASPFRGRRDHARLSFGPQADVSLRGQGWPMGPASGSITFRPRDFNTLMIDERLRAGVPAGQGAKRVSLAGLGPMPL